MSSNDHAESLTDPLPLTPEQYRELQPLIDYYDDLTARLARYQQENRSPQSNSAASRQNDDPDDFEMRLLTKEQREELGALFKTNKELLARFERENRERERKRHELKARLHSDLEAWHLKKNNSVIGKDEKTEDENDSTQLGDVEKNNEVEVGDEVEQEAEPEHGPPYPSLPASPTPPPPPPQQLQPTSLRVPRLTQIAPHIFTVENPDDVSTGTFGDLIDYRYTTTSTPTRQDIVPGRVVDVLDHLYSRLDRMQVDNARLMARVRAMQRELVWERQQNGYLRVWYFLVRSLVIDYMSAVRQTPHQDNALAR